MISFNEIPSNARVPGVYIEIDNSHANTAADSQKILVIAPKGDADANKIIATIVPQNATDAFGADSIAAKMVSAIYTQTKSLPIYTIGVDGNDISNALAAIGDTQYNYIFSSFNDENNINALANFLKSRYEALQQIPGIGFVAKQGTNAELVAFGKKFNSPFISILGVNNLSDTINEQMCAYFGQCADSLSIDPARPLQTLQANGIKTTARNEWDYSERNLLLFSGISTYQSNNSHDVFVERPITTYKENAAGVADDSYLDITTIATAMYFRSKQRSIISSKFARYKLVKDGTNFGPGQAVVTPRLIKAELVALYLSLEKKAIVQDFGNYKPSIICEISADNPNRINLQDNPIFVNGLQIYAGKIQFKKS